MSKLESEYIFCLSCNTWIEKFGETHFAEHKGHDTITEKQVSLQAKTKTLVREPAKSKDPLWIEIPFEVTESRKGVPVEKLPTIKAMGDAIMRKFRFAVIEDMEKKLFFEENRVFRMNGKVILKKILQVSLGKHWKTTIQNDVINYVMASVPYKRTEFDKNKMLLNCKNQFVDLEEYEIKHDKSIMSLHQIDTCYNPSLGRSELFESLLQKCTSNWEMFLEIVACALTKQHINPEKIVILVGSGSNGKSTILRAIQNVFGSDEVSNSTIQEIQGNRFALVTLEGRLLNISTDLPESPLDEFDKIKSITTSEEFLKIEPKGATEHYADLYLTLLFSCNQLPQMPNTSKAIIKRLCILPFLEHFEKDDQVKTDLSTEEEKSKILNTLLYYLDRVITNGGQLTKTQTEAQIMDLWKNNSDGATLFINEMIRAREKDDKPASVADTFSSYIKFCSHHRKTVDKQGRFDEIMHSYGYDKYYTKINGINTMCWRGAALLKTAEDQTADRHQTDLDSAREARDSTTSTES